LTKGRIKRGKEKNQRIASLRGGGKGGDGGAYEKRKKKRKVD